MHTPTPHEHLHSITTTLISISFLIPFHHPNLADVLFKELCNFHKEFPMCLLMLCYVGEGLLMILRIFDYADQGIGERVAGKHCLDNFSMRPSSHSWSLSSISSSGWISHLTISIKLINHSFSYWTGTPSPGMELLMITSSSS